MPHLLVEHALPSTAPWFPRLQRYLATRHWVQALRLLEHVIEDDLPLFDLDQEIAADRRVAWLCRIDRGDQRGGSAGDGRRRADRAGARRGGDPRTSFVAIGGEIGQASD